ncbi:Cell wall beta-glucan synthesis [Penicillium argentinense]|uniref:Cell wall beta-glucan synthesis n=1 Tax=Penicillium argentinense TaxID=1131581 RepID=A0A9W9JVE4_9EURO|nr:Cell wall beta-glucan synthesis [Penicillium argentinense]KAJ5083008.1 Cell wall beta-glucan synthesis [Penicillium argentinense]
MRSSIISCVVAIVSVAEATKFTQPQGGKCYDITLPLNVAWDDITDTGNVSFFLSNQNGAYPNVDYPYHVNIPITQGTITLPGLDQSTAADYAKRNNGGGKGYQIRLVRPDAASSNGFITQSEAFTIVAPGTGNTCPST